MKQGGSLDRLIEFYSPVETADSIGQIRKTYTKVFEDWAERIDLKTIKDSERTMNSFHKVSYGVTQFRIRYRDDTISTMRIKEENVWFDVVGQTLVEGRNHWLLINCEQRDDI
jgi:head-tail adaptor